MPMIDATKWEEFYQEMTKDLKPYDHYDDGYRDAMDNVDDWMDGNQVEAVPVRHGSIIETIEDGRMKRVFSCCGTDFTKMTCWMMPNYCPNCGAKLHGGADDVSD